MYLLHTTTKELKSFYGEEIPKYAILSHMWGPGAEKDEVLFKHVAGTPQERREGKRRKALEKIEGACRQAVEDGWEYIWIDTCCIDRENGAELSEAIKSMYSWYRNAEVCYVYLEDVRSGGDVQPPETEEDAAFPIVPFERSRWFSRGWTLQELIAPQHVIFYSKDWVDIGTKTGLQDAISAITRIRVEMLIAYDPRKASVAEKMSWAAFRKTTRVEDVAYCLMGLLGVNMPLLYGEGDRAFRRLQEVFMKVSDDESLFAWKGRREDRSSVTDGTQGLLATSPWNFRDGMNIVQSRSEVYSPYSMTNQGVRIELPLVPYDDIFGGRDGIFKAILRCTIRNTEPTRFAVIYLQKTKEEYYERIYTHWLDETETDPDEANIHELILFDASMAHKHPTIEVKILPTISGFTVDGHDLVGGHIFKDDTAYQVVCFEQEMRKFGVAIGSDEGIPWLDFVDVIDDHQLSHKLYATGGSRAHVPERHLDRLSEKVPGVDWYVTVSVKKISNGQKGSCLRALIDIQKIPIQAKGWCIPTALSVDNGFSGDFLDVKFDYHNIHPDFKKDGLNWSIVFNPRVKRVLDVSLVYLFKQKSMAKCIRFSRDGKYLAIGREDIARVYDMNTGVEVCTFKNEAIKLFRPDIYCMCFSPDSKFLATGDYDGSVKLWDIGEKCFKKYFEGHKEFVDSLCFSPDSDLIISGSRDGTIRIWDITSGTHSILTEHFFRNYRGAVTISPRGRIIAAQGKNGNIQIWDIKTKQLLVELLGNNRFMHVAFTPDGKGLVCGSNFTFNANYLQNYPLSYWDLSGLVPIKKKDWTSWPIRTFTGHRACVVSVAVSYDGRWVVSLSGEGDMLFWDLKNATTQFVLKQPRGSLRLVDTSPVGNIFATSSYDGTIEVWRYDII